MSPSEATGVEGTPQPRSGTLLFVTYALGPFAPLALRQGKRNLLWTVLTLLALLAWGCMLWRWTEVRGAVRTGTVALVPWLLGVAIATSICVLASVRALWLTGSDPRFVSQKLPLWVRRPRLCMLLGFVLPGFGYLVAAHPRRAVVAAAIALSTLPPWLMLWQADWIWQCNRDAGNAAVPGLALEVAFLAAAVLAVVGTLGWIAGGLDGARLQDQRLGRNTGLHGDRVALALLITWVLTLLQLHPAHLARALDDAARPLQTRGYRLVPLCLEWAATRLDPAEPRYPMVSADLLDAVGKHEAADAVRTDLRRRWESYAEHLLGEEVRIGRILYPSLIAVTEAAEELRPWPEVDGDTPAAATDSTLTTAADSTAKAPAGATADSL